jgi:ribosomal protein S18 acetylase RimI-like enzyme
MDLSFRIATSDDSKAIFEIKRAAFREYIDMVSTWDDQDQWKKHERRFAAGGFEVVLVDGEVAGYFATVMEVDCLRLNQLFIHPDFQGRQIGSAVLVELKKRIGLSNAPIRIQVLKVNPRAVQFYEREGFREVESTEEHLRLEWAVPVA